MSKIKTHNEQSANDRKGSDSPLVSLLIAPFAFAGSLTLGIILLSILLVLLAWGTDIESEYGADIAQFVLYGNVWFYALIALLSLNIVFAILLRFPPWGWYNIPFVVAHVGILLLVFGCFLTWQYGIEAQMTLPEGTIGHVAIKPKQQRFEIQYIAHTASTPTKPIHVSFRPGPFSWQDYEYQNWIKDGRRYKTILWYAMQFGHRDIGELPSGDPNVKIEVLDYYANSVLEPVPPLDVSLLWNKTVTTITDLGEIKEVPRNWELARLDMRHRRAVVGLSNIRGVSETMSQKERVTYSLAMSQEELIAFQTSRPKGGTQSGLWGEIILYYGGKHYSVNVDQLRELPKEGRLAIENSGLQIINTDRFPVQFIERVPSIRFTIFTQSGEMEPMTLFPDNPELNTQARKLGVFGSYWVDPQRVMQQNPGQVGNPMLERLALQRLDFMQGPDKKLYYRFWSGEEIIADGVVSDREGQRKPQFKLAEQTPHEVDVVVDRFVSQDTLGGRVVASKEQNGEQRVKLRVVFDGKEDTFWLHATAPTVVPLTPEPDQIRYIYGKNRTLGMQLNVENIELGFGILLKKVDRRTEPGTRMSSHYSSLVDYVEPSKPAESSQGFSRNLKDYRVLPGGDNVLISMNRPGFFGDASGLGFRIYQAQYHGPFYPDQHWFHELYDGAIFPWEKQPRESIAMSTLSVNADPGRGWKYFGCLLIVLGTTMFVWRKHW